MFLFVRGPLGQCITIDVEEEDTILTVKHKIHAKYAAQPENQRLSFDGDTLEDERTLGDYGIKREATIFMGVRP